MNVYRRITADVWFEEAIQGIYREGFGCLQTISPDDSLGVGDAGNGNDEPPIAGNLS